MTLFDLLFIVLFLTSVVTLLTAAVAALRGRGRKALSILRTFGICLAIYLAIVVAVALASPQRVINIGEPHCFDDWCITVEHAEHHGAQLNVTFKVSSRALRVTQREKGVQVYLYGAGGRRIDPAPDPLAIPLDLRIGPGESFETLRTFTVPSDARDLGLVVAHEGSFCFPACFIIGDDGNPLHKKTIVPLPLLTSREFP